VIRSTKREASLLNQISGLKNISGQSKQISSAINRINPIWNHEDFEFCRYVNRHSSETSVHIRTSRRYVPEDDNIHNYRYENLTSYIRASIVT
jgi:hypothetical protein